MWTNDKWKEIQGVLSPAGAYNVIFSIIKTCILRFIYTSKLSLRFLWLMLFEAIFQTLLQEQEEIIKNSNKNYEKKFFSLYIALYRIGLYDNTNNLRTTTKYSCFLRSFLNISSSTRSHSMLFRINGIPLNFSDKITSFSS